MRRLKRFFNRGGSTSSSNQLMKPTERRARRRQPSQLAFSANPKASTTSSMLQSLLTLYGLVALMHGVVIPISDALAKPVAHAAYRQLFYIFMHGVGIVCLVYLNLLISWHHRARKSAALNQQASCSASRASAMETLSAPLMDSELPPQQDHPRDAAPAKTTYSELRSPLATDETIEFDSAPTATPDVKPSLATVPTRARLSCSFQADTVEWQPLSSADAGISAAASDEMRQPHKSSLSAASWLKQHKPPLLTPLQPVASGSGVGSPADLSSEAPPDTPDSLLTPQSTFPESPITQSETGVNLYLRLGALVFGFGVMIHDGFKISEVIERTGIDDCHDNDIWFIPKQVIHLLFIMIQTYYLFKHHRVIFNTQLPIIRLMMVHLIVTNLCIWVKTVIYEISFGLAADYYNGSTMSRNSTNEVGQARNGSDFLNNYTNCLYRMRDEGPSLKLGPYLYPCAVEYGLICAAISYKVFSKIGDTGAPLYGQKTYPEGPRFTACHKSHRGLFFGLFIMIGILVPLISLQLLKTMEHNYRGLYMLVFLGVECSVLLITSIMSVLGTAKAIRHLKLYHVRENRTFDVNLLFVGLAGILCYNLFIAISVGSCERHPSDSSQCPRWTGNKNLITKAGGFRAVLEVTQSVLQTLFIMQGIQRRITLHLVTRSHKPGRGITIGLLIANLALWIEAVFETKQSFAEDFPQEYFGPMAWSIIKYLFLPLIIFFRFHSSVCLSEIWIHSYKMPKKRGSAS